MAGTAYQGNLVSVVFQGEDDVLNVDMDAAVNTLYAGWNWNQPHPGGIELEQFPRKMTNAFSCTINEQKRETNAETTFIHVLYKISK